MKKWFRLVPPLALVALFCVIVNPRCLLFVVQLCCIVLNNLGGLNKQELLEYGTRQALSLTELLPQYISLQKKLGKVCLKQVCNAGLFIDKKKGKK